MSERSLWRWLSGGILPEGHFTRIESDSSAGFPDVHYTLNEISGTIELKFCRNPKATYPLKRQGFRKSQIDWITAEFVAGGFTALIIQLGNNVLCYYPVSVTKINDYSQDELRANSVFSINKRNPTAHQVRVLKDFLLRKS